MLFVTSKRLKQNPEKLHLKYNGKDINFTTNYKYLGTILDPTLNLKDNFRKTYKKVSSRLKMLYNIKEILSSKVRKKIYTTMILPLLTYHCTVDLTFTEWKLAKLKSVDNRAFQIINEDLKYPT